MLEKRISLAISENWKTSKSKMAASYFPRLLSYKSESWHTRLCCNLVFYCQVSRSHVISPRRYKIAFKVFNRNFNYSKKKEKKNEKKIVPPVTFLKYFHATYFSICSFKRAIANIWFEKFKNRKSHFKFPTVIFPIVEKKKRKSKKKYFLLLHFWNIFTEDTSQGVLSK
jgi:hypothetical protein